MDERPMGRLPRQTLETTVEVAMGQLLCHQTAIDSANRAVCELSDVSADILERGWEAVAEHMGMEAWALTVRRMAAVLSITAAAERTRWLIDTATCELAHRAECARDQF